MCYSRIQRLDFNKVKGGTRYYFRDPARIYLRDGVFRLRNELLDSSEQAIKVGLNDVIGGARLNPSLLVSFIGRAGKEKNRRVRVDVTHPATQFKAIEIRQPRVQQIQVEAFCLNR
jgi:hypothetical protein